MNLKKLIIKLSIFCLFFFSILNGYAFTLAGTWKLISIEKQNQNSKWVSDNCYDPTGLLIYTTAGYMAAGINCMDKNSLQPSFKSEDITFYMGKYFINGSKVEHDVENTSNAALYKKKLVREIHVVNDNKMMLMMKSKNGKRLRLQWEKIENC